MADDPLTLAVLAKFHREVILPDIERVVADRVDGAERRLRDEMRSLFDSLSRQIQELRTEYRSFEASPDEEAELLEAIESVERGETVRADELMARLRR